MIPGQLATALARAPLVALQDSGRPICVECRERYVRRARGTTTPKRGWRVVAGTRYAWFCSKRCSGRVNGRGNIRSPKVEAAARKRIADAEARARARLATLCGDRIDAEGRVSVDVMVEAFMAERRRMRADGYTAGRLRERTVWQQRMRAIA